MSGPINLVKRIDDLHSLINFDDIRDWLVANPDIVGFHMLDLEICFTEYRQNIKAFWAILRWKNETTNILKLPRNRAEKLSKLGFKVNQINKWQNNNTKTNKSDVGVIMRSDDWPALAVAHAMRTAEGE
jgi:hypothetical protein